MFFPESLYLLSARDQQVTWLDPILTGSSLAAALVTVDNDLLTVPTGRCLLLQACHVRAGGGGAQTVARINMSVFPPTAGIQVMLKDQDVTGGLQLANADWQGSVIVPPGWLFRAAASFSAGVAANTVECSLAGLLIPAGNVQRL